MKKRFVLFLFVVVVIVMSVMSTSAITAGAASSSKINVQSYLGQPVSKVKSAFGNYTRIDPSEYNFKWYVFNKNYKNFAMAGVGKDGKVAAIYTNSPSLVLKNTITTKSTRTQVRKIFGKPLTSIKIKNKYYVISHTNEKDVFLVSGYYLTVFYDNPTGGKVASVLFVRKDYEEAVTSKSITMSSALATAFEKQSLDIVNAKRAVNGRSVLKNSSKVRNFAYSRSKDMKTRNYLSHNTPDGKNPGYLAKKAGIKYTSLGENIGAGHRNAILFNEVLMNSSSHRANILSTKYNTLGVGVMASPKKFAYITEIFIK